MRGNYSQLCSRYLHDETRDENGKICHRPYHIEEIIMTHGLLTFRYNINISNIRINILWCSSFGLLGVCCVCCLMMMSRYIYKVCDDYFHALFTNLLSLQTWCGWEVCCRWWWKILSSMRARRSSFRFFFCAVLSVCCWFLACWWCKVELELNAHIHKEKTYERI